MLMHPKDKIPTDQKKDVVYYWECQADGCKSSFVGETSRALGEKVKENCKSSTSAILKHCTDFHHPLPSVSNFNIINKDPSQITWEAKEAIHIWRLDPNFNRNIGKISIPHYFDHLIGAKPKHPWVGLLSQVQDSVDEVAPPSPLYKPTLFWSIFISPDEDLLFEVETSWVNFFASFTIDDQGKFIVSIHNQVVKMNLFNILH